MIILSFFFLKTNICDVVLKKYMCEAVEFSSNIDNHVLGDWMKNPFLFKSTLQFGVSTFAFIISLMFPLPLPYGIEGLAIVKFFSLPRIERFWNVQILYPVDKKKQKTWLWFHELFMLLWPVSPVIFIASRLTFACFTYKEKGRAKMTLGRSFYLVMQMAKLIVKYTF